MDTEPHVALIQHLEFDPSIELASREFESIDMSRDTKLSAIKILHSSRDLVGMGIFAIDGLLPNILISVRLDSRNV
jgi:hypothetical protein